MKSKLFKFPIIDFEEVYVIIDNENKRLHISPLNYSFNITLDLTKDLDQELVMNTKFGECGFNSKVRKVTKKIITELKLT